MLRLGRREFDTHEPVIMAIVNRTPDSFYDQGATFRDEAGAGPGRTGGRRGRRDHRHRRRQGRPGRARGRSRGGAADGRLRGGGPAPPPGRGDQRGHLAARGRRGRVRGRGGRAERRVGRGGSQAGGGRGAPRGRAGVHPRGRGRAADPAAPDPVRGCDGGHPARHGRPGGAGGRAGRPPGRDHDRPGPRLREEHPPFPGGHAPPVGDDRHRLAGPGLPVQQGLRRRDPRQAGQGAPAGHPGHNGRLGLAGRPGLPRPRGRGDQADPGHGPLHPGPPPPAVARRGLA